MKGSSFPQMSQQRFPHTAWPSAHQELLIRAALLDGPAALTAFATWKEQVHLDDVDEASFRLLPQLYQNLRRLGSTDTFLPRLKSVYRYSWYKNQLLLAAAKTSLRSLAEAGIPGVLLKGMALLDGYTQDLGFRPMYDVDLLVPLDAVQRAVALLEARGWSKELDIPLDRYLAFRHSTGFKNQPGVNLDLHWHPFVDRLDVPASFFWERTRSIQWFGIPTQSLNPAVSLVFACNHGLRWHGQAPMLTWLLDAQLLLQVGVDWDSVLDCARDLRLTATLAAALTYLKQTLELEIPETLLTSLRQTTGQSRWERRELTLKLSRPTFANTTRLNTLRFFRFMDHLSPWEKFLHFPAYSAAILQITSVWRIPLELLQRWIRIRQATPTTWSELQAISPPDEAPPAP